MVWRGILQANPWWSQGTVPPQRTRSFRRHAFGFVLDALLRAQVGRGLVVLGPRRVGKTVLLHQVVGELLKRDVAPLDIAFLSLDDVALRGSDLGELLDLLERRRPTQATHRYLLLDEVQHSPSWSGWLKRLADRRDPYVFLATGSSATALRHGGQDAGLGRWQELVLYPWSFREHVHFTKAEAWTFRYVDAWSGMVEKDGHADAERLTTACGARPDDEDARLERILVDYLALGGFPEVVERGNDLREAQRHLRQDILERALGRDIVDGTQVATRTIERLFLRICQRPGGLFESTKAARDLGITRPTVQRYLEILERAFLVFTLPNLASPIRGQPKVYLVAPSLRAAFYNLDRDQIREPAEFGPLAENLVLASAVGQAPAGRQVGFWRKNRVEADLLELQPGGVLYGEVKLRGKRAISNLQKVAARVGQAGLGLILTRDGPQTWFDAAPPLQRIYEMSIAEYLYWNTDWSGGTLRPLRPRRASE